MLLSVCLFVVLLLLFVQDEVVLFLPGVSIEGALDDGGGVNLGGGGH